MRVPAVCCLCHWWGPELHTLCGLDEYCKPSAHYRRHVSSRFLPIAPATYHLTGSDNFRLAQVQLLGDSWCERFHCGYGLRRSSTSGWVVFLLVCVFVRTPTIMTVVRSLCECFCVCLFSRTDVNSPRIDAIQSREWCWMVCGRKYGTNPSEISNERTLTCYRGVGVCVCDFEEEGTQKIASRWRRRWRWRWQTSVEWNTNCMLYGYYNIINLYTAVFGGTLFGVCICLHTRTLFGAYAIADITLEKLVCVIVVTCDGVCV